MKRPVLTALAALVLGFCLTNSVWAYRVYLADATNSIVRMYDTENKTLSDPIQVGQRPNTIVVTPDGKTVYVGNKDSNLVTAIQTADNTVIANIPIPAPSIQLAVTPDSKRVYVSTFTTTGDVSIIDSTSNQVISTFATGSSLPDALPGFGISPNGDKAYFGNMEQGHGADGWGWMTVGVLDLSKNVILKKIRLPASPVRVSFSRNGRTAYFALPVAGSLVVFDTVTDSLVATINPLGCPWGAAASSDNSKVYVASVLLTDATARGAILGVDPSQRVPVDIIKLAHRAFGLALTPDDSAVFVAHGKDCEVSEINLQTREITTISGAYANAIAIQPAPSIGPSEVSLARMSEYVYTIGKTGQLPAPIDGYQFVKGPVVNNSCGFAADVFQKDNQIVIAFRGTELNDELKDNFPYLLRYFHYLMEDTINDFLADASFARATIKPTDEFKSQVLEAMNLLKAVRNDENYKGSDIFLTGHSLGGAIAQVLGNATGLPTLSFNAPGAGRLLSLLNLNTFKSLEGISFNKGKNTNLRIDGDVLSSSGFPIGENWIITPLDENGDKHKISFVISQLIAGAPRKLQ